MSVITSMLVHRKRLEQTLTRLLAPVNFPDLRLSQAMHYAVLNGGKRFRPMLVWASAEAMGSSAAAADIPACALELIHSYSLVHDDLPAMDDDRLRRGKPTCHIRFDEATAILAGDAMQALAFELLAESPHLPVSNKTRLNMIGILAQAAGGRGMVAGQSLDMQAEGKQTDTAGLQTIHSLKTGALIRASILLGALCNARVTRGQLDLLSQFAGLIGLAFQIQDDILDVTGDTATLGKQQGRDHVLQKSTYVGVLGLEGARLKSRDLINQALDLLDTLQPATESLGDLTRYIGQRRH